MNPNNKELTEEQLEQLAKSAVQAIHAQIDIPDPDEAWKKMHVQLRKRKQRSKWIRVSQLGVAIACISVVIGLFSTNPNPAYAFKQVVKIVKDTQEGIIHILFGGAKESPSNRMLTPPPPDFDGEPFDASQQTSEPVISVPKQVSIEEAAKIAEFAVLSPDWFPDGYHLDTVEVYPDLQGNNRIVRMEYRNEASELISYMQRSFIEVSQQSSVNESAGTVKSVQIHQGEGVVILYTLGGGRIEWLAPDGSVLLQISGNLTEEELIKMANSTTKAEDQ